MVVIKHKNPTYIYDPIQKKMVRVKVRKPRRERNKLNPRKGKRNIIGAFPGYIFMVNKIRYICVEPPEGTERPTPDDTPIPVRVFPHHGNNWKDFKF